MGFSNDVKTRALVACKRHCVICEKSKGKKIECHHIIPQYKGGEDTFDNCIPLCFDCHEEIGSYNSSHPKGNKYTSEELKIRRDNFYLRVLSGEFPKENNENQYTVNPLDKQLFEKIQAVFNAPNMQYYLVEVDLGNDFDNNVFEPLAELAFEKENPNFEFVDNELEMHKKNLIKSLDDFLFFKAFKTAPTHLGTQALISWKNENFTYEQSRELSMQFNNLATNLWNSYKELNRICRAKLY
ncbi:HNH endonuclease [Clostridioides difficile]|nr:HNH endonuclease [Clostridioides difficile]